LSFYGALHQASDVNLGEDMKKNRIFTASVATLFALLAFPDVLAAQHTRYKLIDLGTFGGQASYLSNGFDGIQNRRGAVVGAADIAAADPDPGFCFNFDCFVSHAFQWRNGKLTDLGALTPGWSSVALWINESGQAVGISENGMIDPLIGFPPIGFPESRAVLWQNGGITDLGTLAGGYESIANAINKHGQVVGFTTNTVSDPYSFFPFPGATQSRAFLWQNGAMQDLGTLGGPDANALFINDHGQIAGNSYTNTSPNAVPDACSGFSANLPTQDPFVWKDGQMTDLGGLGGTCSLVTGQNNRGQVTGQSDLAGDLMYHPFVWSERQGMHDLGTLGGDTGLTNWISDNGDIVGKTDLSGPLVPQDHHAVLWRHGVMIDLGTFPEDTSSNAYFVNLRGQVVGTSEDRAHMVIGVGEHAFLWENGGPMVDLNTLIPAGSSLQLTYAVAINERGEIAGFGVPPGVLPEEYETKGHAYILIPCDDDHPGNCENEAPGAATLSMAMESRTAETLPSPTQWRQGFRLGRPALPKP
jgi:probable HAF family extracellular repeat protein